MTNGMTAVVPTTPTPISGMRQPGGMRGTQPGQISGTETYSRNVLGPVYFDLHNLRIGGTAVEPQPPEYVALAQSQYIVASNETFQVSVDLHFNDSPLARLLLCLGTKINVTFSFEGVGAKATEEDATVSITTEKDKFNYTLTYEGTPDTTKLTPGFYAIAAVAEIGPSSHACAQFVFGFGYIAAVVLQVYKPFS